MIFLEVVTEKIGEFVLQLLSLGMGALFSVNVSSSDVKPASQFSAEVGVLSGVSYEQHLGGQFTAVGKLGLSTNGEGSVIGYDGLQPAAELGVRWYFLGVSPTGNNEGSYLSFRSYATYQRMAFLDPQPHRHNRNACYSFSLVWGRNWRIDRHWSVKSHVGIGVQNFVTSPLQDAQNGHLDGYKAGIDDPFAAIDLGVTYRF